MAALAFARLAGVVAAETDGAADGEAASTGVGGSLASTGGAAVSDLLPVVAAKFWGELPDPIIPGYQVADDENENEHHPPAIIPAEDLPLPRLLSPSTSTNARSGNPEAVVGPPGPLFLNPLPTPAAAPDSLAPSLLLSALETGVFERMVASAMTGVLAGPAAHGRFCCLAPDSWSGGVLLGVSLAVACGVAAAAGVAVDGGGVEIGGVAAAAVSVAVAGGGVEIGGVAAAAVGVAVAVAGDGVEVGGVAAAASGGTAAADFTEPEAKREPASAALFGRSSGFLAQAGGDGVVPCLGHRLAGYPQSRAALGHQRGYRLADLRDDVAFVKRRNAGQQLENGCAQGIDVISTARDVRHRVAAG